MDEIILISFLRQMSMGILSQQVLINDTITSCDFCNKILSKNVVKECVFCSKTFCKMCCGKEGTDICEMCNFTIGIGVNYKVLNQFTVKELRVISDNYRIPLRGIIEKAELIEALLKNFKKSIEGCNKSLVDVNDLKLKMYEMRIEEMKVKENNLKKEKENEKRCASFEDVKQSNELTINFNDETHVNVDIEDIPKMSIKEMRSLLDSFHIDHSFAIEKRELIDLAVKLTEAYNKFQSMRSNSALKTGNEVFQNKDDVTSCKEEIDEKFHKFECVICMENRINSVFLNCGHSICCYECSLTQLKCPICREDVEKYLKIYLG